MVDRLDVFVVVGLALCLVLSGCGAERLVWSGEVQGTVTETDGEYQFSGQITFGGRMGEDTTLEGVRLEFVSESGETIATTDAGTFDSRTRGVENVSVQLERKPAFVLLKYDSITGQAGTEWSIEGLRLDSNGVYRYYSEYDPEY